VSRSVPGTLPGLGSGDEPARSAEGAAGSGKARLRKSAEAYRTISEVADDLHVPQHVLRFWETKFPRIRPLKRGGGRRYYRPDDVALLRRVADLLYIQGYTIKGVQRLLKEGGGALQDDIPPAAGDERAAAPDEASGRPESPGGQSPADQAGDGLFAADMPPAGDHDAGAPQALAHPASEATANAERLRAALRDLLHGLEALRRKLD
jgi:DNA-binding transcriptional MerR regulator